MILLDNYIESLEALPGELDRNFALLRELDKKTQGIIKEIDGSAENYIKTCRNLKSEEKKKSTDKISDLYKQVKDLSEDKVQLSMQTYEMVDKHIRRLDSELARFEADVMKESNLAGSMEMDAASHKKRGRKHTDKLDKKRGRNSKATEDEEGHKRKKIKLQTGICDPGAIVSLPHPADVLDMPVDPNEPTYCLCHQVSYGEMIGCDNQDCLIEWFHFACVNLETKPKGKWFCPKCSGDRKKKL